MEILWDCTSLAENLKNGNLCGEKYFVKSSRLLLIILINLNWEQCVRKELKKGRHIHSTKMETKQNIMENRLATVTAVLKKSKISNSNGISSDWILTDPTNT